MSNKVDFLIDAINQYELYLYEKKLKRPKYASKVVKTYEFYLRNCKNKNYYIQINFQNDSIAFCKKNPQTKKESINKWLYDKSILKKKMMEKCEIYCNWELRYNQNGSYEKINHIKNFYEYCGLKTIIIDA